MSTNRAEADGVSLPVRHVEVDVGVQRVHWVADPGKFEGDVHLLVARQLPDLPVEGGDVN